MQTRRWRCPVAGGHQADPPDEAPRQRWRRRRRAMQAELLHSRGRGLFGRDRTWWLLSGIEKTLGLGLRCVGLWWRGRRNARRLQLTEHELRFANLPAAFDGYRICHLSDLHIDGDETLADRIVTAMAGRTVDLVALTGDFRLKMEGPFEPVVERVARIVAGLDSRDGAVGVLGNHDDASMVDPLERAGLRLAINETMDLQRDGESIQLVGLDDVNCYFTAEAVDALRHVDRDRFVMAMVHSPEMYVDAAHAGVDLYLAGHTHGGQVCLPGGIAIVRHLKRGRQLYKGRWRQGQMVGITSRGAGTAGLPVRFWCPPEIGLITLRRG